MYTRGFLFLLFSTFFIACSDSKSGEESIDLGYNYFPTQTGAVWIYKVDSLVYDDNSGQTTIDTFAFQYKEQITGTYRDVTGETAQQISRFSRYSDSLPWTELNQYIQMRTSLNAQKVVENTRYVKMVFPLEKNKKWNGNLYNALGSKQYSISYVDQASTIANITYPLTLKIQQQNEVNFILENVKYEIYARNIGLVYALSDSINTQTDPNDPDIERSRGYRYRFTLTSYTP